MRKVQAVVVFVAGVAEVFADAVGGAFFQLTAPTVTLKSDAG
jgi:hypothetical protein